MLKLSNLASFCAATLFVGLVFGITTAGPSVAQGGVPGSKPASDVRVINSVSEPVPINVQGTPNVNVANTPTVNVGNTPNVTVSSLPAVQIGNNSGNPVPVTVTNGGGGADPGTPVAILDFINIQAGASGGFKDVYTVPAGKLLVIESLHFASVSSSTSCQVVLDTKLGGVDNWGYFPATSTFENNLYGSHEAHQYSGPESAVRVVARGNAFEAVAGSFVRIQLQGRLYDVP